MHLLHVQPGRRGRREALTIIAPITAVADHTNVTLTTTARPVPFIWLFGSCFLSAKCRKFQRTVDVATVLCRTYQHKCYWNIATRCLSLIATLAIAASVQQCTTRSTVVAIPAAINRLTVASAASYLDCYDCRLWRCFSLLYCRHWPRGAAVICLHLEPCSLLAVYALDLRRELS